MKFKTFFVFFLSIFIYPFYVEATFLNNFENKILEEYESYRSVILEDTLTKIGLHIKNEGINNNQCSKDILKWMNSLNETWALKMGDSSAKSQSGLLVANLNNLGQFDECLSINTIGKDYHIKGKYCFMKIPIIEIGETIFKNNSDPENLGRIVIGPEGQLTLNYAICIPHSCNAEQIGNIVNDIVNLTTNYNKSVVYVSNDECSTTDREELSPAAITAITIFSIFAALIVFSTIYDFYSNQLEKPQSELLASFSLIKNTSRLLKINKNSASLGCLHGIRVFSMFWVIMGHRYATMIGFPLSDYFVPYEWTQTLGSMMMLGASVSVDTFFVLSGLLLSYIFFKQQKNQSSFNVPLFYFHRFLRIWPAMAALLLFGVGIYPYLGQSPLWPIMSKLLPAPCHKYWWSTLLYIQNYVNPDAFCLGHLWYLCVDMQLYILSPILLYPLLKNEKIGLYNLAFWTIASQIAVIVISYTHNWSNSMMIQGEDQATYFKRYYAATHARATPWLMGFIAGYALFKYQHLWQSKKYKEQLKATDMNIYMIVGWILCLGVIGSTIFGIKPMINSSRKPDALDATYNAFARTGWSAAIIYIVFACVFGFGGFINKLLSWSLWEVLGRLAYSMYLVHMIIQYVVTGSLRSHSDFLQLNLVHQFFGDLILTILISYLWVMAFESPFMVLEKVIFKRNISNEKNNQASITKVSEEKMTKSAETKIEF